MQAEKKKRPTNMNFSKKSKLRGRREGGPKEALKTKVFFRWRKLCVLMAVFWLVEGFPEGKCFLTIFSGISKTFDLSKCAAHQNTFTYFAHLRKQSSDPSYPVNLGELRTYFRYSDKIYLKVLSLGTNNFEEVQVFKTDEGPNPIMRAKINMNSLSKLIFLQVTANKATLAVRSFYNARFDEHNNHEFTFSEGKICFIFFLVHF